MRKRNWRQYNQQLVQRGSLTFLIDPKVMQGSESKSVRKGRGRPRQFPDQVILRLMKVHYCLTYRMLEGFARSVQAFAKTPLPIPTYSAIVQEGRRFAADTP